MVLFSSSRMCVIFLVEYLTYGKFLAKKVFELNDNNPVPSQEINDGVDYVPAKKGMLMGQHFSAIAAAGPVNGPILAAVMFGWVLHKGHPAIPIVSLILLILSVLVSAETLLSVFSKKKQKAATE